MIGYFEKTPNGGLIIEIVKDFLIKLDIKPLMHLCHIQTYQNYEQSPQKFLEIKYLKNQSFQNFINKSWCPNQIFFPFFGKDSTNFSH